MELNQLCRLQGLMLKINLVFGKESMEYGCMKECKKVVGIRYHIIHIICKG